MKTSAMKYTVLTFLASIVLVTIFFIPLHAFLTIWLSTAFGHYTAIRLWKEVLLAVSVLGVVYLLLTDKKIRSHTLTRRLVWIILAYIVLCVVTGVIALSKHQVSQKAFGYALISDVRFLVFFLVAWAVALRTNRLSKGWRKAILVPAIVIVIFGLVQEFFLPPRFLEHFGYSLHTIIPFQYVDNQANFLRIQSTLRGANPFGAYLVVVLSILAVQIRLALSRSARIKLGLLATASLIALYFTYSRSAWIGAILSAGVIGWQITGTYFKKHLFLMISLLIVGLAAFSVAVAHNRYAENVILHTSESSKSPVTSNEARSNSLRRGAHDVVHEPLGRGPGTAGPASVYNKPHAARISENYFLQIGQETGWLGLILFILINLGVGYLLWLRRAEPLALSLFASLVGLTLVNLLSHAWADDTLAYLWWGLAGIAMVTQKKHET